MYREIADLLFGRGYVREQYSVWQRISSASHAWNSMMLMREIRPRGIFASVVRRLQMFRITQPHLFVVTNDIGLGGVFSPTLIGPTPAVLAQGMGVAPPAPWPNGHGDRLPYGLRSIHGSFDPNNWRLPVRLRDISLRCELISVNVCRTIQ